MRISDWSSDVCSSDLLVTTCYGERKGQAPRIHDLADPINTIVACGGRQALIQAGVIHQDIRGANSEPGSNASLSHAKRASIVAAHKIGRASCRDRVCRYV